MNVGVLFSSYKTFLGFFIFAIKFKNSLAQCGLTFNSAQEQVMGFALSNSEYRSFSSTSYATCLLACEADMSCMSLNFLMSTSTCDLNRQTMESTPGYFTERHNSIYTINPSGRTISEKGTKTNPAKSCLDVLKSGVSVGTGEYWLEPVNNTGSPVQAYCDMTTDKGGWTIIKRIILQGSNVPKNQGYFTYEGISKYNVTDRNVYPKGAAMLDILRKMGFHQIHFYCHKKLLGRVVSIMTKNDTAGQEVVRFFTNDTLASTTFPAACGSFDRLPEDTSILAQNCTLWGKDFNGQDRVDKWNYQGYNTKNRINARPFSITYSSGKLHIFGIANRLLRCDDDSMESLGEKGDILQISVR